MLIEKRSEFTGKLNTMDLDITEDQLAEYLSGRGLIQSIFPNLSPTEREFLMTGASPEEWSAVMGGSSDDQEEK